MQVRTGLPGPLRGSPVEFRSIWEVFYASLSQYFNRKDFAPPETYRIPKIAHGNVIDYADEKLWQSQKLLTNRHVSPSDPFLIIMGVQLNVSTIRTKN